MPCNPVNRSGACLQLLAGLTVFYCQHDASAQHAADAQGHAAPPTSGALPSPVSIALDHASLAGSARASTTVTVHGTTLQCEGVAVTELMRKAGVMEEPLRGAQLTRYVLASGRDGYRAVFSLAEFDPSLSVGQAPALVADRCDGKALDDKDGPLRLLFPADQRPARWIRQLQSINVIVAP